LMVLTFTLGASLLGPEEQTGSRELLIAAIGCNLAWGIIDAFLYLLTCLYERRQSISLAVPPEKLRLTSRELRGAALVCFLVLITAFPAALPFLFIENSYVALRVSNAILIGLLFLVGARWGRHVGAPRPWLTGLLTMAIGVVLVLIAIPLGG
jgi:VIT1/CCC1 family predicted Fe2+/Mn2+ transporter